MSDEPKKRSRAWIGWILLSGLILYPLSIGPASWWTQDDPSKWAALDTAYAPIRWLGDRVDCVGEALDWYHSRWVRPYGR
jgi:hypothetical protein